MGSEKTQGRNIEDLLSLDRKDLLTLLARELIAEEPPQETYKRDSRLIKTRETKIFLSYARLDADLIKPIYDKLYADGFLPWMDTKSLIPGEKWSIAIEKAIEESDFVIICLSKNSTDKRGFVQKEIRIALEIVDRMLDDDIYLIPARLDNCNIPRSLSNLQWVDLFEVEGYARLLRALREGLTRRVKGEDR